MINSCPERSWLEKVNTIQIRYIHTPEIKLEQVFFSPKLFYLTSNTCKKFTCLHGMIENLIIKLTLQITIYVKLQFNNENYVTILLYL